MITEADEMDDEALDMQRQMESKHSMQHQHPDRRGSTGDDMALISNGVTASSGEWPCDSFSPMGESEYWPLSPAKPPVSLELLLYATMSAEAAGAALRRLHRRPKKKAAVSRPMPAMAAPMRAPRRPSPYLALLMP